MTDLPFIRMEFIAYLSNMSDKELHQELVGQWNATKDFDEFEYDLMIMELDKRSHKDVDRLKQSYMDGVASGISAEREACAKVCENIERNGTWITKAEAAAAIRARGEK